MQIGTLTVRDRSAIGPVCVGACGCLFALILGAAVATSGGLLVASAAIGLAFCVVAIMVYDRDPVLALIGLWLFAVFNGTLSAAFGYFSSVGTVVRQGDEALVLLFVCLTAWQMLRMNVRLVPLRFVLPGVGVAVFGITGAILHEVPLVITVLGAWLGLKLWVMVGVTLLLPWKQRDIMRVYTALIGVGLFVAALGLVDFLTHDALSRALGTSIYEAGPGGYRAEAVHSIFPQPGEYSLFMSVLFALTFSRFAAKRSKADLILALLFAGSIMLSLRLKGFLSLAAVVIIVALVQGAANNRGSITILLVGALLVVGIYSVEGSVIARQFSQYTSSETSARARLYETGSQIALDNFPLGAGFGRFASYASRLYYSPIYYQYGLSNVYGLSRAFPNFIDDTSWPTVIGETGYSGFVIYLSGVMLLILAIIRRLRTAPASLKWVPLAALCTLAVLLMSSLGAATLFDWLALTSFAMILGPALIGTRGSVPSGAQLAQPGLFRQG